MVMSGGFQLQHNLPIQIKVSDLHLFGFIILSDGVKFLQKLEYHCT